MFKFMEMFRGYYLLQVCPMKHDMSKISFKDLCRVPLKVVQNSSVLVRNLQKDKGLARDRLFLKMVITEAALAKVF